MLGRDRAALASALVAVARVPALEPRSVCGRLRVVRRSRGLGTGSNPRRSRRRPARRPGRGRGAGHPRGGVSLRSGCSSRAPVRRTRLSLPRQWSACSPSSRSGVRRATTHSSWTAGRVCRLLRPLRVAWRRPRAAPRRRPPRLRGEPVGTRCRLLGRPALGRGRLVRRAGMPPAPGWTVRSTRSTACAARFEQRSCPCTACLLKTAGVPGRRTLPELHGIAEARA